MPLSVNAYIGTSKLRTLHTKAFRHVSPTSTCVHDAKMTFINVCACYLCMGVF